jgi:ribosomal protein S12 methylthiotransferase accessory factor
MLNLFASAASLLLGEAPDDGIPDAAHRVLEELGYAAPGGGAGPDQERRHRARLLRAASQFIRIFELAAPEAPGLVAFGAEVDPAAAGVLHQGSPPANASGIGLTVQEAFQGCVGEGIEYLSQLQGDDDVLVRADLAAPMAILDQPARDLVTALISPRGEARLSWYRARRMSDGGEVLLPADLCLRRPAALQEFAPAFPLSIGSAAGPSWEAAALHGLLELIERDAASLWWRGGRPGRAVAAEVEASANALLRELRAGVSAARHNRLLDITTDTGIPAVVAFSFRPDGFGFAFGLAARRTVQAAARSAVLEMCQMELAQAVVEAKRRERGDAALNARDRAHLQRATTINAGRCALLHPGGGRAEHRPIDTADPREAVQLVVQRLAQLGIATYSLDLTRERFAIPVARMIVPALQAEPSELATGRLADMIAQTGGGAVHTGGISLI